MRQETFAILFLMRKGRPKKNGLAPIFARITTGGLRQEVYTQCDSNPETWNQHKERAMGTNKLAIQVNERLNDFRVKIIDIRTKLLAEGYAANAAQIKQRYLNPTCNTMMLIAGLADYAKRRQGEVGVRITQRTADKYERLLRYLKQYLAQRGKAEDIPVERMNYEFLDGFNLFLQTAHRCRHNGAVAVMDCLRNFVLYCLRNEWITKNPFRYYKLKEDEVQAKEHDYKPGDKLIPFKIVGEYKGPDLVGMEYEQLIPWVKPIDVAEDASWTPSDKGFRVISRDYVTTHPVIL